MSDPAARELTRSGLLRRTDTPWLLLVAAASALIAVLCLSELGTWGSRFAAFAALVGLALFVWHRPMLAAAMIPVLFPLPQFLQVFAYEVAALATFALLLLAGIAGRREWAWRLHPIEVAALAFVAWGAVTVLWSDSAWWWLFAIRKYGMGVVALWTAWRLARHPGQAWRMFRGLAWGFVVLAVATLAKAIGSGALTLGASFQRVEGTSLGWGGTNYIAALLVLMLPTALFLATSAPDRHARFIGWLALPLASIVLAVSGSRGGALLMVAIALLFLFRQRLGKQLLMLVLGLTAAIVLLVTGPGSELFLSRFTSPRELGSVVVRLFLLRAGWRRLVEHFPFGMGLGQGVVAPDHLAGGGPHNFLVTVTYETGLPGLLLWLWVLGSIVRHGWRHLRVPGKSPLAQALLFTCFTGVANSMFEGTFEGLHFQFLFFWIMGSYLGALSAESRVVVTVRGEERLREAAPSHPHAK